MRVALIGDIHSNQYAFEEVLEDLKDKQIDQVLFLGDYAFGGSGSCECVDILMHYRDHPSLAIAGNKEGYIAMIEAGGIPDGARAVSHL